jgi:hypothetical protein
MAEEMPPQVLPTATGLAASEALAMLRKHNIATAGSFRLRWGLSLTWSFGNDDDPPDAGPLDQRQALRRRQALAPEQGLQ